MHFVVKSTLVAIGLISCVCGPSFASGSTSQNMTVSANVASNCTLVVQPMTFGVIDPLNVYIEPSSEDQIVINCTQGTAAALSLADAAGESISTDPTQSLYPSMTLQGGGINAKPLNYTTHFLAAGWTNPYATATGEQYSYTLWGGIPVGQDVSVGTYQDTLVATVSF